ncbi:alpha-tocopherol transfer protein-like [Harmonia axyridis]|uniref:alpha-tocopherol transfer protein-like n=1 Tax=Harmonia axyridis TaxID=115357 RepID=UPI001E2787EC|nr:alpha-tocopherol transfer protein-like [Harmonia axyridis]XP_045468479.1 alpha-tocopherol transfer protein-like [Harmonia axyridis]
MGLADVKKEYEKNTKLKKEDIENLRSWVQKQPHLPELSELQYILFLQSTYYSNEQAKKAIENYFTVRTLCKELFRNGDIFNPGIQMALDVAVISILPRSDPNGYKVVFMRLLDTNLDKYHFVDHLRMFDMLITLKMHLQGTNEGINLLFDLEGVSFGHLLRLSPVLAHKYLYYLQEGLPIRLKNIYVANAPYWIDKALAFFKPFLKKELYDAIHIHTDLESLYKVIPREIMPKDYGGEDVDYVKVLAEKNRKIFEENEEFFKEQEKQITDESKRLEKLDNYSNIFGLDGTFRKLELD